MCSPPWGDVMGMVDGDGNLLYTMVYEGYGAGYYFSGGSAAATMLLGTNPLGYRGYVTDSGTGLYYLQSRYYDPVIGRFLNADAFASTGQGLLGNNMFAYCLNNPVNMVDYSGHYAIEAIWAIILVIVAAVAIVIMADCFARIVVILINELISSSTYKAQKRKESSKKEETEPEPPDVTYPGDDPTKAPDGYEWRGEGESGSKEGNYYNPETGESWHSDLDHPEGKAPHWDYNYRGSGVKGWRVYGDGTIELKK